MIRKRVTQIARRRELGRASGEEQGCARETSMREAQDGTKRIGVGLLGSVRRGDGTAAEQRLQDGGALRRYSLPDSCRARHSRNEVQQGRKAGWGRTKRPPRTVRLHIGLAWRGKRVQRQKTGGEKSEVRVRRRIWVENGRTAGNLVRKLARDASGARKVAVTV